MAVWLPALKIALPYITQVVSAAIPAFTSRGEKGRAEDVPQQISELQTAVTHNAESVKLLATQLQQAVEGIDAGAANIAREIALIKRLSLIAIGVSVVAIVVSALTWFPR